MGRTKRRCLNCPVSIDGMYTHFCPDCFGSVALADQYYLYGFYGIPRESCREDAGMGFYGSIMTAMYKLGMADRLGLYDE